MPLNKKKTNFNLSIKYPNKSWYAFKTNQPTTQTNKQTNMNLWCSIDIVW